MSLAAKRSRKKAILSIVIMVLFLSNYHICNLVYGDDLIKWWKLKLIIYTVFVGLCFCLARIGTRKLTRFVLSLCIGFCLADIFDRVFFDCQTYKWWDIILIIATIITSYIECYGPKRSRTIKG